MNAKSEKGVNHWLIQRITAVILIPASLWIVAAFIKYLTAPYSAAQLWLSSPFIKSAVIVFTAMMFYHGYLGIQVILEDYIPNETTRTYLIYFTRVFSFFMTVLAIMSIIQIS
jgi:succinate dehydrogenase / fumarate reductase membrane anchor subunit